MKTVTVSVVRFGLSKPAAWVIVCLLSPWGVTVTAWKVRFVLLKTAALAQPWQTFDGCDLYPTPIEKAATLGFSLIQNHPFLDGNKRIGHAAMEVLLTLHGLEIDAAIDEQEACILGVAAGTIDHAELTEWVGAHVCPYPQKPE